MYVWFISVAYLVIVVLLKGSKGKLLGSDSGLLKHLLLNQRCSTFMISCSSVGTPSAEPLASPPSPGGKV